MRVLVILEPELNALTRSGRAMITAALKFSSDVTALILGKEQAELAKQACLIPGVTSVLWANHPSLTPLLAESSAACVLTCGEQYDVILAPGSTFGKNLLPRVAAKLNVAQVSEVTQIIDSATFEHPIYAGNAVETVRILDSKKLLTIRTTAFQPVIGHQTACSIEEINTPSTSTQSRFINYVAHQSKRPELTEASIVVSGGRALQNTEKFKLIESLADCLGAAVGASRAAVDAGFVPNDFQVGQTGKIVAPQLYFAIGISGAIQHIAGMQESKVIVAINKDPDAPIFKVATYGLVGDLFEIVPKLIKLLSTDN